MSVLYELRELNNEFLMLAEMLEDDPSSEVLKDTLEGLAGELEVKYEGYCTVLSALNDKADSIKHEITRLSERKIMAENAADRLKKALYLSMQATGKRRIEGNIYTMSIKKTAPQLDEVPDWGNLPKEYLVEQEPKVDRRGLLADVKAGKNVPGVTLRQGECLVIK